MLVRAKFRPRRLDDLAVGAAEAIGREGVFYPLWTIEAGPYAGERAMALPSSWGVMAAWVPEGDLEVVEGPVGITMVSLPAPDPAQAYVVPDISVGDVTWVTGGPISATAERSRLLSAAAQEPGLYLAAWRKVGDIPDARAAGAR